MTLISVAIIAYCMGAVSAVAAILLAGRLRRSRPIDEIKCFQCNKDTELSEREGLVFSECPEHGRVLIAWEK